MVNKGGFTMLEACISMLVVVIFMAMSLNVLTQKKKKPLYNTTHGYFMCYYNNSNQLKQNLNGSITSLTNEYCTFKPIKSAEYYIINLVGSGTRSYSSFSDFICSTGQFRSHFVDSLSQELRIKPGKNSSNSNDMISSITNSVGETLSSAEGGKTSYSGLTDSFVQEIQAYYNGQLCSSSNSYCKITRYSDHINLNTSNFSKNYYYDNINLSQIKNNTYVYSYDNGITLILVFKDEISRFGKKNTNIQSEFSRYIKDAGLEETCNDIKDAGNVTQSSGKQGAVLILW